VKIIDIPALIGSLADVYGPTGDNAEMSTIDVGETPHELLAAMVRSVLDVHRHDLFVWDSSNARAIDTTDVGRAEFAICAACGMVQREYFWCWTIRGLYVTLTNAFDPDPDPVPGADTAVWQGWRDMAEAIKRARAAYPGPVATAVVRALNNPAYSLAYRTNLLDALLTCTQAVPAQPARVEG
jgi:hypothetical protein